MVKKHVEKDSIPSLLREMKAQTTVDCHYTHPSDWQKIQSSAKDKRWPECDDGEKSDLTYTSPWSSNPMQGMRPRLERCMHVRVHQVGCKACLYSAVVITQKGRSMSGSCMHQRWHITSWENRREMKRSKTTAAPNMNLTNTSTRNDRCDMILSK